MNKGSELTVLTLLLILSGLLVNATTVKSEFGAGDGDEDSDYYATDGTHTNDESDEADGEYEDNGNTEGEVEIRSTINIYLLINLFRIRNTKNTFVIVGKWEGDGQVQQTQSIDSLMRNAERGKDHRGHIR
ncbi:hypothetical protein CSKR_104047 [Clonorchis sinensis]|uniref:Uncharacterized protein n=1 Tax=Clonorchis sinensis TaxID=79923 RepID=A0A8T1MHN6_CLOSI|nr:hypothetical protein CSKR_104047 [Clonorchis sinensis]